MITLRAGTALYHGTIHEFEEIRAPCWFATVPDQAVNHVAYRYPNNESCRLMKYQLKQDVVLLEQNDVC